MNMVDDATGTTQARLGKEETIWAAARVLQVWMEKYGVPRALYTDWKNVYQRAATSAEQLRGKVPITQFGRMCQKLGIEIIAASSPQAKGRVERNHGTHQDRLIKKLRRKQIDSHEAANQYLEQEYLPQHNQRLVRLAGKPEDYRGRKRTARELHQIFRLETERTISNDWVIRHEGLCWQLQPGPRRYGPTRSKAPVCEWEDGTMEVYYRGKRMAFTELPPAMPKASPPPPPIARTIVGRKANQGHPWRQPYQNMRPRFPTRVIAAPLVGMRTSATP